MVEEKEFDSQVFQIEDRLVVKLIGKAEDIQKHILLLKRLYGANRLNCSPILKNKYGTGFFCFINILSGGTERQ